MRRLWPFLGVALTLALVGSLSAQLPVTFDTGAKAPTMTSQLVDLNRMLIQQPVQLRQRTFDHFPDGNRTAIEGDCVSIELRHLGGFSDQAVEAITFFVDHCQQFFLVVFFERCSGQQCGDGCLEG